MGTREGGGSRSETVRWARLVFWSCVALFVFRVVDTSLYGALAARGSALAVLADVRVSSLALLAAGYGASRRGPTREMPVWTRGPDPRTRRLAIVWLAGVFLCVHFLGVGKIPLARWENRVAHLFTGVLAEELLCRGLVLGAALAIWRTGWRPIAWSAVVFAAMHLQYHGFRLDGLALAQLVWTLPQGAMFATIAVRTRSLLFVVLLHIANNVLVFLA